MSKFRSKIEAMIAVEQAEKALGWIAEDGGNLTAITVTATVHYGSVTDGGKAAQPYIHRAAQAMHSQIIELAREMAQADLEAGEKLL